MCETVRAIQAEVTTQGILRVRFEDEFSVEAVRRPEGEGGHMGLDITESGSPDPIKFDFFEDSDLAVAGDALGLTFYAKWGTGVLNFGDFGGLKERIEAMPEKWKHA